MWHPLVMLQHGLRVLRLQRMPTAADESHQALAILLGPFSGGTFEMASNYPTDGCLGPLPNFGCSAACLAQLGGTFDSRLKVAVLSRQHNHRLHGGSQLQTPDIACRCKNAAHFQTRFCFTQLPRTSLCLGHVACVGMLPAMQRVTLENGQHRNRVKRVTNKRQ